MPLAQRIRFVRMNLATQRRGRLAHMSLDEFAEAVGAKDRHRPMAWEKGQTPRDYARRIAALTPYPAAALGADGGEELLRATLGARLRALEGEVSWLRGWVTVGFEALGVSPELQGEAPPPLGDDARHQSHDLWPQNP